MKYLFYCKYFQIEEEEDDEKEEEDDENDDEEEEAMLKFFMEEETDVNWKPLLSPAPMGIAIMSQLLFRAESRIQDRKLTDKKSFNLIKHPESFRYSL